jgi:hypothetical protein
MLIKDFLHYSEVPPGTSGERTIYGQKEDGLFYDYDDRLWQWDSKAHDKAVKENTQELHTSEWYEEYLTLYYGKKIELRHILIGVNVSSGFCYKVFGYKEVNHDSNGQPSKKRQKPEGVKDA